jgi:hypothetical protein
VDARERHYEERSTVVAVARQRGAASALGDAHEVVLDPEKVDEHSFPCHVTGAVGAVAVRDHELVT